MKTSSPTFIISPVYARSQMADHAAPAPTRKFQHHPSANGRSFAEILASTSAKRP